MLPWHLAEFFYVKEFCAGAWLVDIGLRASRLFLAGAESELDKGVGELWEIA